MITVALSIPNSGPITPSSEIYSVMREQIRDVAADRKPCPGICCSAAGICPAGLLYTLTQVPLLHAGLYHFVHYDHNTFI